jgi:hypothetical protein
MSWVLLPSLVVIFICLIRHYSDLLTAYSKVYVVSILPTEGQGKGDAYAYLSMRTFGLTLIASDTETCCCDGETSHHPRKLILSRMAFAFSLSSSTSIDRQVHQHLPILLCSAYSTPRGVHAVQVKVGASGRLVHHKPNIQSTHVSKWALIKVVWQKKDCAFRQSEIFCVSLYRLFLSRE